MNKPLGNPPDRNPAVNEAGRFPDQVSGIDSILQDLQYKLEDVADFIDELTISGLINADSVLLDQAEQTTMEMRAMLKYARDLGCSDKAGAE